MVNDTFKFQAKKIPTDPGCYLFFDTDDALMYVGKAKQLRKRVSSYFQKTDKSPKTASMIKKITRIETRVTTSEMEALILENNLVKKHLPKYNILLRDDKNFLYLRITADPFPRLEVTRRIVRDGSFYLGPRTSAKKFRATIAFCQKIFQIRTCRLEFDVPNQITKNSEKRKIPCLDFHIKKCSGPCAGDIDADAYRADVDRMKKFLRGDTREVLGALREKMMVHAKNRKFEAAAHVRDLIASIDASTQRQTVELTDVTPRDFVHWHRDARHAYCVRLVFRHGKLLDQNEVRFAAPEWASDAELSEKILLQLYDRVDEMPAEIFVPHLPDLPESVGKIIRASLLVPQRGEKRKILELAEKNAKNFSEKSAIEVQSQAENFAAALPQLAEKLNLPEPPRRIECYDISHFGGTHSVASQVVFVDGVPKKSEYRRFKIKSLDDGKIDDFAAMREVLQRRFRESNTPDAPDTTDKWMKKNQKILNKVTELQKLLGDLPYWLLGGLGLAFAIEKMWRSHDDLDVLVEKKAWKKVLKIFETGGFERVDHSDVYVSLTKKGWPPIDLSPTNSELAIGKFGKKQLDPESHTLGKTSAQTLTLDTLLAIKINLQSCRKNKKDTDDIEQVEKWKTERERADRTPDLLVVDGGKGQLSAALDTLPEEFQSKIISLAKREEEVFVPRRSTPIELPADSAANKLLQRCRDEAHRFAITFNRSLREKTAIKSAIDEVPGIGPTTKKKLMQKFGSVSGIRAASDTDLSSIVNKKQLSALRRQL